MGLDEDVAEVMARSRAEHRIEALLAFLREHPTAALVAVVYESEDDDPDGPTYEVFYDTDHARAVGMLTTAATDLAHSILFGSEADE